MFSNKYQSGGPCGGAIDLGLTKCIVDKNTIKPFTQIEEIKHFLEKGFIIKLESKKGDILAIIQKKEDIPYKLWS